MLICGVGSGTKQLQQFLECTKSYEAVVLFGVATDTYDRVGKIVARKSATGVTREVVEAALEGFRGKIMQKPPLYSALRVEGKRLYEYAREGKDLPKAIQERPVEVVELKLLEWMDPGTHNHKMPEQEADLETKVVAEKMLPEDAEDAGTDLKRTRDDAELEETSTESLHAKKSKTDDASVLTNDDDTQEVAQPANKDLSGATEEISAASSVNETPSTFPAARLRMTVTSGFYVRSLCHDLGIAVGSVANMGELVRTRQSDFVLGENVFEYSDLAEGQDFWAPKVEKLINDWNEDPARHRPKDDLPAHPT